MSINPNNISFKILVMKVSLFIAYYWSYISITSQNTW